MSTDLSNIDANHSDLLSINNNDNSEDVSDASGAGEDWSRFGSAWSDPSLSLSASFGKPFNDLMDLSDFPATLSMDSDLAMGIGMEYSYSSTMGIDPASLHFNPAIPGLGLGFGYSDSTVFSDSYGVPAPTAGFGFQSHLPQQGTLPVATRPGDEPFIPQSFTKERRLSITSSSSSSAPSSAPSPPSGYTSDNVCLSTKDEPNSADSATLGANTPYASSAAAELALRVCQSAGVMLAVPVHGFGTSIQAGANISAGKLPIPRLNRSPYIKSTATAPPSSSSSAASTPPPSTPPSASHSPLNISTGSSIASVGATPTTAAPTSIVRPKTSHTTIERRYRTNLNARIQSLRMSVPALRVLEDRDGSNGKKIKKNIKGGVIVKGGGIGIGIDSEDGSVVDVIDERGFVDGVKVARKCSKANVLGKAVEYIRVLKRRERRLKAELGGVKVLVEGLVGGAALIREWEKQWRARFGGEEKDEVEGEDDDCEGEDDESEDEDGDEGDEEGAGRKRKRARLPNSSSSIGLKKADSKKEKKACAPLPPVVMLAGEQGGNPAPEKRKRGRPRKILPPPVTLEPVATAVQSVAPGLLPAIVLQKEGSGMPKHDEPMQTSPTETSPGEWRQQQQQSPQQYLLAVFALFSFFNSPFTSLSSTGREHSSQNHHHTGKVLTPLYPPLVYSPEIVSQFAQPSNLVGSTGAASTVWKDFVQLFHLVVSILVLASFVGNWLGFGVGGLRLSLGKSVWGSKSSSRKENGGKSWISFAEESILSGQASSLSRFEQLQVYRAISERRNTSVGSLVSVAIALNSATGIIGRLAHMEARKIWDDARARSQAANKTAGSKKLTEELIFRSMDLDGACERLARLAGNVPHEDMNESCLHSAILQLGSDVVKERLRSHLSKIFVDCIGGRDEDDGEEGEERKGAEEKMRRHTVDGSRELGGKLEEMGRLFERIWKIGVGVGGVDLTDVERVFSNVPRAGVDEEIRSLFIAIVLYSRLFCDAGTESGSCEESDTETETGLSASSTDTVVVSGSSSSWSLLSPPPSPGRNPRVMPAFIASKMKIAKRAKMMLDLRGILGCRVFESCVDNVDEDGTRRIEGLEEARDRAVDLIVESERRHR